MKTAFLTGITGQVGSFLAELLLKNGYLVHGLVRRSSTLNTSRIEHILGQVSLHWGDLSAGTNLVEILNRVRPDEVFHLGAQSHVRVSYDAPEYTFDVGATGTMRLLEALRVAGLSKTTRFYNAASSEIFGGIKCPETGYTEESAFHPRSPYGVSKLAAYWATKNYREAYGFFGANGIVFNTESSRRGEEFVTKKIARAVARIEWGLQDHLTLGNLEARRDWSYAPEAAEAIYRILQHDRPDDFVIATGIAHSVEQFCEAAFQYRGLNWREHIVFDETLLRPAEVDVLIGDSSKARRQLGWEPKVSFGDLVMEMVDAEIENIENGNALL